MLLPAFDLVGIETAADVGVILVGVAPDDPTLCKRLMAVAHPLLFGSDRLLEPECLAPFRPRVLIMRVSAGDRFPHDHDQLCRPGQGCRAFRHCGVEQIIRTCLDDDLAGTAAELSAIPIRTPVEVQVEIMDFLGSRAAEAWMLLKVVKQAAGAAFLRADDDCVGNRAQAGNAASCSDQPGIAQSSLPRGPVYSGRR